MSANQLRSPTVFMGHWGTTYGGNATLALSAAATWLAFQFVPSQAKTLNTVRFFLSAATGTLATSDCTLDLYSDAAGVPNVSIEGPKSAGSIPAAPNWIGWSGFTTALTAGTPYWLVLKNANGTPASNFPTYRWPDNVSSPFTPGPPFANSNMRVAPIAYGWNKAHSTNGGTTWGNNYSATAGFRLGFSDSTYDGFPIQSALQPSNGGTAERGTGKQEVGVRFNVPSGATWNILGAWFPLIKNGSPGSLRFRLYQGTTLLATSNGVPAANVTNSTGEGYTDYFPSAVALSSANNPYRLVFGDATAADANTAGYNSQVYTFDSDANSLILKPMDGSVQKTVTADNTASPPVFTDTAADFVPFALLGDTNGELTSSGGGGTTGAPFSRIITGY